MKFEDKYTWKEIGELFADRIETTKFLSKFNKKKFLEWFNAKESLGLRFDWKLVARAYSIWNKLHDEADHFTVIIGAEGSGKTTMGEQFCSWISPKMDMEDIVFDMPKYISKLKEIEEEHSKKRLDDDDRSILIDEGGINLFSREAMTISNRVLAKTFMVQRFLNVHVCICIPHYWSLDPLIRNHRINTIIMITERGKYKSIVGKGIKIMNKLGKKDKDKPLNAIPIPYGYFWDGNFRKDFTNNIDKVEYEQHKRAHIKQFLEQAHSDALTIKMVKLSKAAKELGLKRDTLVREIESGRIKGKKIGHQWFITKKAYDKIIME